MNKLAILLGLILVSSYVFAQTEDVIIDEPSKKAEQTKTPEEIQTNKDRIQQLYVSCIIATRFKLDSIEKQVMPLLESIEHLPLRIDLYKKILAEHIYQCGLAGTKHANIPKEIAQQVEEKTFKIENWEMLFTDIKFEKYSDPEFNHTLTDAESKIMKFVESFDEAMSKGRHQEPQIANLSVSNMSKGGQMLYVLLIIGLFSGLIFYGYKKIVESEDKPKIKKEKKKQQ